jgi:hypothetical protein
MCYNIYVNKIWEDLLMDTELTMIQINQDLNELAEQYAGAASNERLWAKGAPDVETAKMHEENAIQNHKMSLFYGYLASRALDLLESFEED